ncbi:MAG: hypothetical protein Q8M99_05125 [Methylotenera sp.]|nr:hypothetical protein [Methylotenera sp.]
MMQRAIKLFISTLTHSLSLTKGGWVGVGAQRLQPIKTFKILTGLLIGLFSSVMAAQIQAEPNSEFGRLFSKPNERSNLNILRQNQKLKPIGTPEALPEAALNLESATPTEPITLQGYVKRSDGKSTLWINNKAVQENSAVDNVKIGRLNNRGFSQKGASTEGVDVKIPASGKHIRLKAGQRYEPETNQIVEMQVVEKAKRLNLEDAGVIDDGDEKSMQ